MTGNTIILLVLLCQAAISVAQKCSTIGSFLPPKKCPSGLTCVIDDFGFPAVDRPNSGHCKKLNEKPPICTVDFCAMNGAKSLCVVKDAVSVSTCGAWANRSDSGPKPVCPRICTLECAIGNAAPLASNGKRFCNVCVLKGASCDARFEFYGPIDPKCDPTKDISPFDRASCCFDFGIKCVQEGDICSTSGAQIPGAGCDKCLTCVLFDFGFPAVDVPNRGVCRLLKQEVPKCSVRHCLRVGASGICNASPTHAPSPIIATCKAWATQRQ